MYREGSAARHFMERMIALVRDLEPDRLVIENSGWEFHRGQKRFF
ncbi:MAG: hypothetical protein WBH66_05590 [Rectinemataceae bacterium]